MIHPFDSEAELAGLSANNCTVALTNGALAVVFKPADWPNVYFKVNEAFTNGDWREWNGLAVDVLNTNSRPVKLSLRVDDDFSADGKQHCRGAYYALPPGRKVTLVMPFVPVPAPGMVGSPPILTNALSMGVYGPTLDWSHIVAFQFYLEQPATQTALFLDNVRLVPGTPLTNLADRYGQFTGADWPGKIHKDEDFAEQNHAELSWLAAHPKPSDRDQYGGWQEGPQLEATGYFRTMFVTNVGRWWLVDPAGRLFYSLGVDVVDYGESTIVAGREKMFGWLPEAGDLLAKFVTGGNKPAANFHGMNLFRKYGTNWKGEVHGRIHDRLDAWGFNTLGDWSALDLYGVHRTPYTVSAWYEKEGLATFKSAAQTIVDVYDTNFPARVAKGMTMATASWKEDPWCLGYFVDNEIPWADWNEGVTNHHALSAGVLAHDGALPSKGALAGQLQQKYDTIEKLNVAWNTGVISWETFSNQPVKLPVDWTPACTNDLSAFLTSFADRYFSTISTNLKQQAPHQLYLGCKFASHPDEAVKSAAHYCDVVSFDIYIRSVDSNAWSFTSGLNKPCLSAEFHIGALDRGMFHTGLVSATDQADRGRAYQEYVRSVAALPAFVGCHWFQYHDEPLTGRSYDGENYNIGMVSGTDTPYEELISFARQINTNIYSILNR